MTHSLRSEFKPAKDGIDPSSEEPEIELIQGKKNVLRRTVFGWET